ncbi:MAG: rhomboid family intramembrane serine protease [Candidatus Dormibacteraeota bacterium]|nr:rhomboid family intramembrane serine protease [Candidatus Dormibacteraeota bacterium]
MTDTPAVGGPAQEPVVLAIAQDLVTRYRLRLADNRDSRLAGLDATYDLAAASWTGQRAALVAFYTPQDTDGAGHDLARRCEAARRWGQERLQLQGAQVCDILLVALRPVTGAISTTVDPAERVRIGAAWVDAEHGTAEQLLPIPPNLPSVSDLRRHARAIQGGAVAPTLAAVDLAERQTVAGGYVAPVRRAMVTQPYLTYAFIAAFVAVYLVEKTRISSFDPTCGLLSLGALPNSADIALGNCAAAAAPTDWWRYISSAFIHDPTDYLHIIFNGLAMLWIGRIVEQLYGRLVLAGTFLVTAAAGNLVWIAATAMGFAPVTISFGASGGISGLVGLLLVLGRVQGRNVPPGLASGVRQYAVLVIVINVVFGFVNSGVNNFAHLGGLVAGALLGLALPPLAHVGGRDLRPAEQIALGAVIAVSAIALVIAGVTFVQAGPAGLSLPAS